MRKNYLEKYKMNNKTELRQNWTISFAEKCIPARVPGDITLDLYNSGLIENPYYGLNHKKLHWITDSDFKYNTVFDLSDEIILEFDGIDTFADIYLNGKFLGHTENMFLKYTFSVKGIVQKNANELSVRMRSAAGIMNGIDDKGYFGVFNTKRLFIRKLNAISGGTGLRICPDTAYIKMFALKAYIEIELMQYTIKRSITEISHFLLNLIIRYCRRWIFAETSSKR